MFKEKASPVAVQLRREFHPTDDYIYIDGANKEKSNQLIFMQPNDRDKSLRCCQPFALMRLDCSFEVCLMVTFLKRQAGGRGKAKDRFTVLLCANIWMGMRNVHYTLDRSNGIKSRRCKNEPFVC